MLDGQGGSEMNMVISQALATGLPVIATRHSGLTDQVIDGFNGFLVDEGDYTALAETISYFITHTELWAGMSRSARDHVLRQYNSRWLVETQIEWYVKLTEVHRM